MEGDHGRTARVVILPCFGMGHLIPHAELAKQLVLHHGLSVTIVTMADSPSMAKSQEAFLKNLPAGVNSVSLPHVEILDDIFIIARLYLTILRSLPALHDVLYELKQTTRLVAFVADAFCLDAFDVAKEVGVTPYIFYTSNLFFFSLSFHLPSIYESNPDLPDLVELPGCIPLDRNDFPDLFMDPKSEAFLSFMHHVKRYREAQAILVNSFQELEPGAAAYFAEKEPGRPPIYLVGPLLNFDFASPDKPAACLQWLDRQPVESVLYISFGSMGVLSYAQTTELALGLEMSGQRFIWVLRPPADKANVKEIDSDDPLDYLPQGFLERTKELGFVVTGWAPQVPILSHSSTEGFLTHCGWNSTIESLMYGVAMIAWPIYAEQRMNAAFVAEEAKMALRPKVTEDGVVKREEVARLVTELMEGEEGQQVRDNVRKIQKAAAKTLSKEGNSYQALTEIANKWKNSSIDV